MDSLNIFGETPLHLCIASHRLEFAEKLIDSGCDLYKRNGLGQSPLYFAALFGDASFVKLLISKGFKVNGEEREGLKALAVATQYSHDEIADIISREIRTDSAAGGCSIQ